jgi:hypothetical protein
MISLPIIILIISLLLTFTVAYFQGNGMTRERALIAYLVATGISLIFGGIGHIFAPQIVSKQIGWKVAPQFQFEIGIANIAFGILSLLTFFYRKEFILSTIIATTIWGWGNSIGHIQSYLKEGNSSPGNTGWALYLDSLMPLISIFLYINVYHKYI